MPKCYNCGKKFKLPKGRQVCYLCDDCRDMVIMRDPQYEETSNTEGLSTYYVDEFDAIIRNIEDGN